jgi:hypothetical protein
MKRSVKPRNIWHPRSQIKPIHNTDADNEDIYLPSSCDVLPEQAVHTMTIPSIIQYITPLILSIRYAIKEISGTNDVMRGGVPSGVTSGVAINELQTSSNSRPLQKGDNISKGMMQVAEMIAYICQDFDDTEMDGVDENGKPITVPNEMEFPDDSGTDTTFIKYRPGEVRDLGFRVIGTTKKSMEVIAQICVLIANLKQSGIDPKILLHYIDDPIFEKLYIEAEAVMMKQQAEAAQAQMAYEEKQIRDKFAMDMALETVKSKRPAEAKPAAEQKPESKPKPKQEGKK